RKARGNLLHEMLAKERQALEARRGGEGAAGVGERIRLLEFDLRGRRECGMREQGQHQDRNGCTHGSSLLRTLCTLNIWRSGTLPKRRSCARRWAWRPRPGPRAKCPWAPS